jgi:ABC-type Fe3+-hydroxamate transport system substrate-binding protein
MGPVAVDRLVALLGVVVILATATACGERSEPTGSSVPLYPVTVTGAAGRPLDIDRPAERIAVLDPALLEVLDALGARRRVVGLPVEPNGTINVTRLVRLHPDLIVAPSSADEVQLSRASAAAHVPVYVAPGNSLREVEQTITELGLIAGQSVQARRLVHRIEAKRRFVDERLDGAPTVSVFFDTGLFTPVSDQSLVGDLIREARGRNVVGQTTGPVEPSELLSLDPRFYLTTADSGTTLRDLKGNRQTRKLRAVRKGGFGLVDAGLLEPVPQIGDGLIAIARLLHPDAFR